MQLSAPEAAAALDAVEDARTAMRHAIRAHRGHFHLWIWGAAWVAMPLVAHFGGERAARYFPWIALVAGVASTLVGFAQSRQIRAPINRRFLGVIAAIAAFAVLFPFVLQVRADVRGIYAYICLVAMQAYVIAGLWTDSYLLWLGMIVSALVVVGLFVFPGIFWLWMAVCGGGTLIGSGFYVRHFWR